MAPYESWLQATIKPKGEEEGWNLLELVMKTRTTTVSSEVMLIVKSFSWHLK